MCCAAALKANSLQGAGRLQSVRSLQRLWRWRWLTCRPSWLHRLAPQPPWQCNHMHPANRRNSTDLAAPGEDILTTLTGGGYGTASGTSLATPHVAATAALVQSVARAGWVAAACCLPCFPDRPVVTACPLLPGLHLCCLHLESLRSLMGSMQHLLPDRTGLTILQSSAAVWALAGAR